MKLNIEDYKALLEHAKNRIRLDIREVLSTIDYKVDSPNIQILKINNELDLDKLYTGRGFYLILTDHSFTRNPCNFQFDNFTAIYRGEGYYVKKRVTSHLGNEKYKRERKSNEPNYTTCLKINDGEDGINIDQKPYLDWNWLVIVHKMRDSNSEIRKEAELAFDSLYGKPIKSRE